MKAHTHLSRWDEVFNTGMKKKNMKYSDRTPIIGVNDLRIELTKKKNVDKCQYNLVALHEN